LWFHATLASVALIGPGRPILVGGWRAVRAGAPSMDTLVGLGVSSAYVASLVALIWPQVGWPCFFNEPVMLLGFVLLGRFLEERARVRTGRALQQLAALQPNQARLVMADGSVREVPVSALRPGERLQLLAGDRIPVDGVVIEGCSAVDVSSLTGEPLPLEAAPGTELSSGSLNLEATLVLEAQRVGAETALARIIALVEQAQARKAPIQGLADRVAGMFCYGVISLATLTFVFWWQVGPRLWPQVLAAPMPAAHHHSAAMAAAHGHGLHGPLGAGAETPLGLAIQLAIAVLVIACPCALGLATPTVITVSSGLAARQGWLFRGGDVIELAAGLDRVVFDKTGTLTLGLPWWLRCWRVLIQPAPCNCRPASRTPAAIHWPTPCCRRHSVVACPCCRWWPVAPSPARVWLVSLRGLRARCAWVLPNGCNGKGSSGLRLSRRLLIMLPTKGSRLWRWLWIRCPSV